MCQIFLQKMSTFFFSLKTVNAHEKKISNLQKNLQHNFIVIYSKLNTIYINKIVKKYINKSL